MALTPEDVLNKNFTATQFRRGYDEQEVDDFLDEVVVELRRLLGENAELRRKLGAAGSAVHDGGATQPEGEVVADAEAATKAEVERIQRDSEDRIATARAAADQAEKEAAARIERATAEVEEAEQGLRDADQTLDDHEQQSVQSVPSVQSGDEQQPAPSGAQDAAGVIALAQRLHDEYVSQGRTEHDRLLVEATSQRDQMLFEASSQRDEMLGDANTRREQLLGEAQSRHDELLGTAEVRHHELLSSGQSEHDRLLAEATQTHERLITEARERSTDMVTEAQQKRHSILEDLERQQTELSTRISELRGFEQDYRQRLRAYIEGQLHTLMGEASVEPNGEQTPATQEDQEPSDARAQDGDA
ncbi:MAG: DivIVA domain-containing protein [Dermatophilaceae bacterium]